MYMVNSCRLIHIVNNSYMGESSLLIIIFYNCIVYNIISFYTLNNDIYIYYLIENIQFR